MSKNPKEPKLAGQIPELDEIDLSAALPPAPPPKRGRGRPRSVAVPKKPKTRKTRKDKGIRKTPKTPYIDNNILISNNEIIGVGDIDYSGKGEYQSAMRLKDQMTGKELKFLEIYLKGGHNIEEAAILAGYAGYSQRHLYRIGQKIVEKYESQADDHRIILRAMGAGEVEVINGLLALARGAKSEMVRLNAWSQLSKILGLTKEQLEGVGGLTIIFDGPGATASLPGAPPAPGQALPAALPMSTKPLMITK